jgi:hypothetical protein
MQGILQVAAVMGGLDPAMTRVIFFSMQSSLHHPAPLNTNARA